MLLNNQEKPKPTSEMQVNSSVPSSPQNKRVLFSDMNVTSAAKDLRKQLQSALSQSPSQCFSRTQATTAVTTAMSSIEQLHGREGNRSCFSAQKPRKAYTVAQSPTGGSPIRQQIILEEPSMRDT